MDLVSFKINIDLIFNRHFGRIGSCVEFGSLDYRNLTFAL